MNIFKILANGDGTINEANVSAFLGYLLDPYADHGLGFEFLDKFLTNFFDDEFKTRKYDYEIIFEQAFKEYNNKKSKKEIVDIIIACFDNQAKEGEKYLHSLLSERRIIKQIFLLEIKIKGSLTKDQVKNQYEKSISELKSILTEDRFDEKSVFSIYLTPDDTKFDVEFNTYSNKISGNHIIWNSKVNEDSVLNLLKEIISDETKGEIEAINEYTKYTIKSFIMFIENDFKSKIKEEDDDKEGKGKKDIFYEIEPFLDKYGDKFNENSQIKIRDFTEYVNNKYKQFTTRHSRAHACAVFSSKKLFGFQRKNKKELEVQLVNRNPQLSNSIIQQYTEKIEELKLTPIKENWGFKIKETDIDLETIIKLFELQLDLLNLK